MAKIIGGVPPFVGTRDNLTIYLMNGEYIIRTKSSLTGKRVKRDPAFAKTMKYAGWLKQGSRIASHIYRQLPPDERVYKQYRELTGRAMSLLKEAFDAGDVIIMLEAVYLPQRVENVAGMGTDEFREYSIEYSCEYASENSEGNSGKCSGEYIGGSSSRNSCEYASESSNRSNGKYKGEYTTKYTAEYSKERVKYSGKQIRDKSADRRNHKRCYECSCTQVKCNGKCAKEFEYAHEYILPCYNLGDRPQRAVQVGIAGLSYLKYAGATDGDLIEFQKPIRPLMFNSKELQRTTASDPILQP